MKTVRKYFYGIISTLSFVALIISCNAFNKNVVTKAQDFIEPSNETIVDYTLYFNNDVGELRVGSFDGEKAPIEYSNFVHIESDPNNLYIDGGFNFYTSAETGLVVPDGSTITLNLNGIEAFLTASKYGIKVDSDDSALDNTFKILRSENSSSALNITVTGLEDESACIYNNVNYTNVSSSTLINGAFINMNGGYYGIYQEGIDGKDGGVLTIEGKPEINIISNYQAIHAFSIANSDALTIYGSSDVVSIANFNQDLTNISQSQDHPYLTNNCKVALYSTTWTDSHYDTVYYGDVASKIFAKSINITRDVHDHGDIYFTTPLSTLKGTLTSGSYYLTQDVTPTGDITIAAGSKVNICLNGYMVTLKTYHFIVNGELGIYNCNNDSQKRFKQVPAGGYWSILTSGSTTGSKTIKGGIITGATSSAFVVNNGSLTIDNVTLIGNGTNKTLNTSGAVINATNTSLPAEANIVISNSTLFGNLATTSGGAIYGKNVSIKLDSTSIDGNYSPTGAGVYLDNSSLSFADQPTANKSIDGNYTSYNKGTLGDPSNVFMSGNCHLYFYGDFAGQIGVGTDTYNTGDTCFASSIFEELDVPTGVLKVDNDDDILVETENGYKIEQPSITILNQPTEDNNYTVLASTNAIYGTASFDPDTLLSYQWYVNDEPIEGQTGSTLTNTTESGDYYCEITLSYNEKTYTVQTESINITSVISNYAINFSANGGSGVEASLSGTYGSEIKLPSTVSFTNSGYELLGFNTKADGTGTSYSLGQTITIPNYNLDLYCHWAKEYADITFDKQLHNGSEIITGNYYIFGSYSLSENIVIPSGSTVNLYLNDNEITLGDYCINIEGTLNLYSSNSGYIQNSTLNSAINVASTGTFNIYGGVIKGNSKNAITNEGILNLYDGVISNNGSSAIVNNKTFNMYDGEICNNSSANGSGVYVGTFGTFIMTGGSIYLNTSTQFNAGVSPNGTTKLLGGSIFNNTITSSTGEIGTNYGGAGLRITTSNILTIGNDVKIYNNKTNNNLDNILLVGTTAKFSIDGLTNGSNVSVNHTLCTSTMEPISITNSIDADYSSLIKCDNDNYSISYVESEDVLKIHMPFIITYYANGGNGEMVDENAYNYGDEVTIKTHTFTRDGYIFKGYSTSSTSKDVVYEDGDIIEITSSLNLFAVWKIIVSINEDPQTHTYENNDFAFTIKNATSSLNDFTVTYKLSTSDNYSSTLPHNAGNYDVKIVRNEDYYYDYFEVEIENGVVINKARYDFTDVRWTTNYNFVYDGKEHVVELQDTLPAGVTVAYYVDNKGTNAGRHVAEVYFNYDETNYETPTYRQLGWGIDKAPTTLNESTQKYSYDGNPHAFAILENNNDLEKYSVTYKLHEGSTFTSNVPSIAGNYDVKIEVPLDERGNYTAYSKVLENALVIGYKVDFVLLNETSGTTPESIDICYGNISLPLASEYEITRTNYEFYGWSDGENISKTSLYISSNVTLTTIWAPIITNQPSADNNYTVTVSTDDAISYQWYYQASLTSEAIAVSGQTTNKLSYFENGGYYFCTLTYDLLYTIDTNKIFVSYICFDLNGGEGLVPSSKAYTKNSIITMPSNVLTKEGYDFAGYNTKVDGTGTTYAINSQYIVLEEDVTFYALWTITYESIVFDKVLSNSITTIENGNYYLKSNLSINKNYVISSDKTVNIFLNGYSLEIKGYSILNYGTLSIYDNGTTTTKFSENDDGLFVLNENGAYEITGGYIYNATSSTAITNNGTLTLNNINLVGNKKGALSSTGDLFINNSNIIGNTNTAIAINSGSATISNSTISHNSSINYAGIYVKGSLTLNNSTISYNNASIGAGLYYDGNNLVINNSTISDNMASIKYAGVYVGKANATINGVTITNNLIAVDTLYKTKYEAYGGAGLAYNSNITLGGKVTITNNKINKELDNLACVSKSNPVIVIDNENGLSLDSTIGFSHINQSLTMNRIAIASENETDYSSRFVLDNEDYAIVNKNNILTMQFIYRFNYDANGGIADLPDEVIYYEETIITIPELIFIRSGYAFVGLCSDINGKGEIYQSGEKVTVNSAKFTLYAIWRHSHIEDGLEFDKMITPSSGELVSGNYFLDDDVTLTENIVIPNGANVNLCLNGKILNLGSYQILNSGTLTIYDCQNTLHQFNLSNGRFVLDETGHYEVNGGVIYGSSTHNIMNYTGSNFILNGGNIAGSAGYGVFCVNDATINGGSIVGNAKSFFVGKTLTMTDGLIAYNSYPVTVSEGLFTLNGGEISNNSSSSGGALFISGGQFVMNGGEIKDNVANYGAAIYAQEGNEINISLLGGKITNNNTSNADNASAAVYLTSKTTFTLGGTINIYDNFVGTKQANVLNGIGSATGQMESEYFLINVSKTNPLTSGAKIGITNFACFGTNDLIPVSNALDNNYVKYFVSDMDDYAVGDFKEEENHYLKMQLPYKVTYVVTDFTIGEIPVDNKNYGNNATVELKNGNSIRKVVEKEPGVEQGYCIYGWTTIQGSDEVMYSGGSTITINSNLTLYGVWGEALGDTDVVIDETPQSHEYTGLKVEFEIIGEPTDEFKIKYLDSKGNEIENPINVGVYTVVIHRDIDFVYKDYDVTIENGLTITKANATIDTSSAQLTYVYNGLEQVINSGAVLNHKETSLIYENNKFTTVGEYEVTIRANATTNYNEVSTTVIVKVEKADAIIFTSGVLKEYIYNGNEITVSGATLNHSETKLEYSNHIFTDAGEYEVTINASETANYKAASTTFKVIVHKAKIDMSKVTWNYSDYFVYDAKEHTVIINPNTLPALVTVEGYEDNSFINAGSYKAIPTFTISNPNYELSNVPTLEWSIEKANYNMSGITFENKTYTFDGLEKGIEVSGTLPTGLDDIQITVSYSGYQTNVCQNQEIVATFATTSKNYNTPKSMKAYLTINKFEVTIAWSENDYTYNGNVQVVCATYKNVNDEDIDLAISYNKEFKLAGSYQITVGFKYGETNYVLPNDVIKSYEIKKQVIDMSDVTWDYTEAFTYDGDDKIVKLINLPSNLEATYENNDKTNAGEYSASATLNYDSANYTLSKEIEPLTWKINKADSSIDLTSFETEYVYTGKEIVLTGATLNHDEVEIIYEKDLIVHPGHYNIKVKANESLNYNSCEVNTAIDVIKADASIDVSGLTLEYVYNGLEQELKSGATLNHNETELVYENNKFTNAGTYTVTIKALETTDYNEAEVNVTVVVLKADAIISTDEVIKSYVYTGNEITISNATLNHSETTLVYENNKFTNADTYEVKISATETTNYNAASVTFDVVVSKAKATISLNQTPIEKTYGTLITLPEATSNFGKVLCNTNASSLENVGEYTITYYVEGTDNYFGDSKQLKVIINPYIVNLPTYSTYDYYKDSPYTTDIENTLQYTAKNITVSDVGIYYIEVTLVSNNYAWNDEKEGLTRKLPFEIKKSKAQINLSETELTYTYGDEIKLPTPTSNFGQVLCDTEESSLVKVGQYKVTYYIEETDNYVGDEVILTINIVKKVLDTSKVKWDYINPFTYSKDTYQVLLKNVPKEINVIYTDNEKTDAGNYIAIATLDYDTEIYELTDEIDNLNWEILKDVIDMSAVSWDYTEEFAYDGESHFVEVVNLPYNVIPVYEDNEKVNCGTYTAYVTFEYDKANYFLSNDVEPITFKINKAFIDTSAVAWDYENAFTYDGLDHEVLLSNLPDGVSATYSNNKNKDAGQYIASASLVYDTLNYELTNNIGELVWTINVKYVDMSSTTWNYNNDITYDGNEHVVTLLINNPDFEITYSNNKYTNAGEYIAVANISYNTKNYTLSESVFYLTWKINKKELDTSAVTWNYNGDFTADGNKKTVYLINVPDGMRVEYTNNEKVNEGTYTAKATLSYDAKNYVLVNGQTEFELEYKLVKPPKKKGCKGEASSLFVCLLALGTILLKKKKYN